MASLVNKVLDLLGKRIVISPSPAASADAVVVAGATPVMAGADASINELTREAKRELSPPPGPGSSQEAVAPDPYDRLEQRKEEAAQRVSKALKQKAAAESDAEQKASALVREHQHSTILKIKECSEPVMKKLQFSSQRTEKSYEKALSIALNAAGVRHRTQVECHEEFMGQPLPMLYANLVVEDVVVELKATKKACYMHVWKEQVLRYMSLLSKAGEKNYAGLIVHFNKRTDKVEFAEVGSVCPASSSAWVGRMWVWATQSWGLHTGAQ